MRVTGSFESIRRFERVINAFLGFWIMQGVSEDLGGVLRGFWEVWANFHTQKSNFGAAISYHIFHFKILL